MTGRGRCLHHPPSTHDATAGLLAALALVAAGIELVNRKPGAAN